MKRRMEQLLNGRFIYQAPKLVLSDSRLDLKAPADDSLQGELFFAAEDNSRVKGMLSSTHRRIVLEKDKFSGNAIHIRYAVDTRGLKNGERFEGLITISCPLEEVNIPVCVKVEEPKVLAFGGEVRSLDGFVKLAKSSPREAFRLYTHEDFVRLLRGKDAVYLSLYRGMSRNPVTYQHMEEFLVAAGKKEPIAVHLDKEEKRFENLKHSQKDTLYVYKNTWGFVRMEIDTVGDFLQIEKRQVSSEDFIGSVYGLEYIVRKDRLRKGKNYGSIQIHTVYGTLTYKLMVSLPSEREEIQIKKKQSRAMLLRQLLSYKMGELSVSAWKEAVAGELSEAESQGRMDVFSYLYLSYVYYENENAAEALAACWPVRELVFSGEEAELAGMTLYLKKLVGILDISDEELREKILQLRVEKQESFPLLWVWLACNPGLSAARKLIEYERIFSSGCVSPFLYAQVWEIFDKDVNQLKKLTPLAVHSLLLAARMGRLSPELAAKTACLARHEKDFNRLLYRVLEKCYEICPDKEVLTAILSLIMRGSPHKPEYFRWYSLAVQQQLRMTGLYEYYIETMQTPFVGVFPQVIRLYFAYNNRLTDQQKAFVYANVIRNKEADRVTYQSYREAMGRFALEQLKKGRINQDYALIYREFITKLTDKEMAEAMAAVLFTAEVTCRDKKIRSVLVVSPYLTQEMKYPMQGGRAYIQLYTGDEQILFEDERKRRYGTTIQSEVRWLFKPEEYVDSCLDRRAEYFGLFVHQMIPQLDKLEVTETNIESFQRIGEDERFVESCRETARTRVLEYYTKHEKEELPDQVLKMITEEHFAAKNKALVVKTMLQRRMYVGAFDLLCHYGYEHIDTRLLYNLCTQMIVSSNYAENEEQIYLAFELFGRNKVNEVILMYLRDTYVGPLELMDELRDRLKQKGMDTRPLDEELLILSMYVRKPLRHPWEILSSYLTGTVNEVVSEAFLTFCAFRWLMADEVLEGGLTGQLEQLVENKEECNPVCRLAILKDYVYRDKLGAEQKTCAKKQLEWLNREGVRLPFYKDLPADLIQAYQLEDRLFIEEKAGPEDKITIYYRMPGAGQQPGEYKSEPMKNMFQGIFVKEFLLFYGETLEYYLVTEHGGVKQKSEIKKAACGQADISGKTKYQLLNRILAAKHLRRGPEFEQLTEEYLKQDALSKQAFTIL